MCRVAVFALFCILSLPLYSPLYAGDLSSRHEDGVSLTLTKSLYVDTLKRPIDTLKRDSLGRPLPADTIPQYIVLTDTIRTYPFDMDALNRINIRQIQKPKKIQLRPLIQQVADDYCLYKPKYWSKSLDASLNVSEASFSKNWRAGGLNSLSALATVNGKAEYARYDVSWTNELQSQLGEAATFSVEGLRKTADRLYLDSKFAVKIHNPFFLFSAINFQSQFINGNNYLVDSLGINRHYKVSGFLSPGYLTESLGLEFKPKPYFSLRLGLGSFRQTFVIDTTVYHQSPGNYGVPVGERSLTEGALQLIANFDKDISKNVHLIALLQLFEGYTRTSNTSGRLDLTLTGKITKLLHVSFNGTVLYDRSQDTRVQFTQLLALGVGYKFSDF